MGVFEPRQEITLLTAFLRYGHEGLSTGELPSQKEIRAYQTGQLKNVLLQYLRKLPSFKTASTKE